MEDNNARLIAGILQASGLAARYLNPEELGILVTDEPQNARILPASYTKINAWAETEEILVIPGFLGIRGWRNLYFLSRRIRYFWCIGSCWCQRDAL